MTLGAGIGGGLILNGRLYRDATKVAGEIGQTSIDYQGKDFVYGNKGALEAYVGHVHISERAKRFLRSPVRPPDEEADPRCLAAAANSGESLPKQLWEDIGLKLGVGLINAIWLCDWLRGRSLSAPFVLSTRTRKGGSFQCLLAGRQIPVGIREI